MEKTIHSAFYVSAKSANETRQSRQISSARQQQSKRNNDTKVNKQKAKASENKRETLEDSVDITDVTKCGHL